ncbi:MAG TPA: L-aspartate oxidase, partial [Chitinivibrionales bacterium]
TFAIHASRLGSVVMITKKSDTDSNTNYAQGGIACVLDPHDSFKSHVDDTLIAGAGLCDEEAVRILVEEGPQRIEELIDWGTRFSTSPRSQALHRLDLGREGGHSANRIVHTLDLTGREVEESLLRRLKSQPNVSLYENHATVEFITNHHLKKPPRQNRCYGAYVQDAATRHIYAVRAKIIVCASGGSGKVYLHTTNPEIATGDGVAMAYRAGADIANMEFIQFHPTTLYHEHANSFLISEALRGFGAVLKDKHGRRFMDDYHALGSLAPRDIVARAIDKEMKTTGDPCEFLDIRHIPATRVKRHFPYIYKRCKEYGIDITKDLIPIVPAAHYMCGGILVDHNGNSSLANLYALGEVACTGIHGANRLASNSLLEALVFSHRASLNAATKLKAAALLKADAFLPWDDSGTIDNEEWILLSHNLTEIQTVMGDYVGIVRSNLRLERALRRINFLEMEIEDFYKRTRISPRLLELRNVVTTAKLIIRSALARRESRGLHYTTDYPNQNDRQWKRNTVLKKPVALK